MTERDKIKVGKSSPHFHDEQDVSTTIFSIGCSRSEFVKFYGEI